MTRDEMIDEAVASADGTNRASILRAMDKKDRLGYQGVFELLTSGRRDKSGDFMPGCGLSASKAMDVLGFMAATDNTIEACKVRLINWLSRDKSEKGQAMADDILDNREKFDAAVHLVHQRLNSQEQGLQQSLQFVLSELASIKANEASA